MSSVKNLRSIQRQIERYSLGDFTGRIRFHGGDDYWDAVSLSLNMLGEELREITVSKELFLNIFNAIPDLLLITNGAGKVLIANGAASTIAGIGPGNRFDDHFRGAGAETFQQLRKSYNIAAPNTEYPLKRLDDPERFFICKFSEIEGNTKRGRYIALIKDVTERELAAQQIAASEQKFRELFDNSSDGILLIDKGGAVLQMNASAYDLVGLSPPVSIYLHDILRFNSAGAFAKQHLNQLLKGTSNIEVRVRHASGASQVCLLSSVPVRSGAPEACQLLLRNISQYREYNKILFRAVNEQQERERERIANDLHDSIGQHLSSLKFMLSAVRKCVPGKEEAEMLSDISTSVSQVIDELRNVSFDLMPGTLHHFGLRRTIEELLERMKKVHPLVLFRFDAPQKVPEFAQDIKLHCYRMVQEFIANSMKHGEPLSVTIIIKIEAEQRLLVLQLEDDGKGFNLRTAMRGNTRGLQNIISRTDSCGGHVKMKSSPGEGSIFTITIPIA